MDKPILVFFSLVLMAAQAQAQAQPQPQPPALKQQAPVSTAVVRPVPEAALCQKAATVATAPEALENVRDSCELLLNEAIKSGQAEKIVEVENIFFQVLGADIARGVDVSTPLDQIANFYQKTSDQARYYSFYKKWEDVLFPGGAPRPLVQYWLPNSNLQEAGRRLLSYYATEEEIGKNAKFLINLQALFSKNQLPEERYFDQNLLRLKMLIDMGNYGEARDVLKNFISDTLPIVRLTPSACLFYIQEGEILYAEGDLPSSMKKITALLFKLHPPYGDLESCRFEAQSLKAFILIAQRQLKFAAEATVELEKMNPHVKFLFNHLYGRIYRRMGDQRALSNATAFAEGVKNSIRKQTVYYALREKLLAAIYLKNAPVYAQTKLELDKLSKGRKSHPKNTAQIAAWEQLGDAFVLGKKINMASYTKSFEEIQRILGPKHPMIIELKEFSDKVTKTP